MFGVVSTVYSSTVSCNYHCIFRNYIWFIILSSRFTIHWFSFVVYQHMIICIVLWGRHCFVGLKLFGIGVWYACTVAPFSVNLQLGNAWMRVHVRPQRTVWLNATTPLQRFWTALYATMLIVILIYVIVNNVYVCSLICHMYMFYHVFLSPNM
jgi:hypothetical protein